MCVRSVVTSRISKNNYTSHVFFKIWASVSAGCPSSISSLMATCRRNVVLPWWSWRLLQNAVVCGSVYNSYGFQLLPVHGIFGQEWVWRPWLWHIPDIPGQRLIPCEVILSHNWATDSCLREQVFLVSKNRFCSMFVHACIWYIYLSASRNLCIQNSIPLRPVWNENSPPKPFPPFPQTFPSPVSLSFSLFVCVHSLAVPLNCLFSWLWKQLLKRWQVPREIEYSLVICPSLSPSLFVYTHSCCCSELFVLLTLKTTLYEMISTQGKWTLQ